MDGKNKPIRGASRCSPGAIFESWCVPGASWNPLAPPPVGSLALLLLRSGSTIPGSARLRLRQVGVE